MKCSNCPASAQFAVLDPGVSPIYYCNRCLPPFLKPRAAAGQLDIPKQTTTEVVSKKKKKALVEQPVEETLEEPVEVVLETADEGNEV